MPDAYYHCPTCHAPVPGGYLAPQEGPCASCGGDLVFCEVCSCLTDGTDGLAGGHDEDCPTSISDVYG